MKFHKQQESLAYLALPNKLPSGSCDKVTQQLFSSQTRAFRFGHIVSSVRIGRV